jgi:hypothetical protein
MASVRPIPSLVPDHDVTVHLVLDDFGRAGRAYRETDEERADLGTVIDDLLTGQFNKPVRIVAFNTAEGWARDVSEDVAWEVVQRARNAGTRLTESTFDFVAFHIGEDEALRIESQLL